MENEELKRIECIGEILIYGNWLALIECGENINEVNKTISERILREAEDLSQNYTDLEKKEIIAALITGLINTIGNKKGKNDEKFTFYPEEK